MGRCHQAPVVEVGKKHFVNADVSVVQKALEELGFHTESLDILGVYEAAAFRQKK